MTHREDTSSPFRHLVPRWLLWSLLVVLLFLGVSTLFKQRQLSRAESQVEGEQLRVVERAYDEIVRDFERVQADLLREARSIAEERNVVLELDRYTLSADPSSEASLVRFFAGYSLPDRRAVELYTSAPRLVAWKGFSVPEGRSPIASDFLSRVQVEIVDDGGVRQALAVWVPIIYQGRAIGAVRSLQLIGARMPVENQFLQNYSLADTWRRATRLPVRVWLNQEVTLTQNARSQGIVRSLPGLGGESLGLVFIPFPGENELIETISNRYSDIQAVGVVLFFLLVVALLVRVGRNIGASGYGGSFRVHWGLRWTFFVFSGAVWWGGRFILLWLDAPARWQRGKAPLAPLFDPTHFASDYGWGLMRSMGDLFTTAVFALVFTIWFVRTVVVDRSRAATLEPAPARVSGLWLAGAGIIFASIVIIGLTLALGNIVHHAVIDSSLDYFARTGLLPDRLVFFVFCSLILLTLSVMGLSLGLSWMATRFARSQRPAAWAPRLFWIVMAVLIAGTLGAFWRVWLEAGTRSFLVAAFFLAVSWGIALGLSRQRVRLSGWLHFRSALLAILLMTIPLYLLLSRGMDTQLRERMVQAAGTFDTGKDLRVIFAMEQVLYNANESLDIAQAIDEHMAGEAPASRLDTLAQQLLRGSSLASVGAYDISVTLFDTTDVPVGRYVAADQDLSERELDRVDLEEFSILRAMYEESGTDSILVEQVTGRLESDQVQYEGLGPIILADSLRRLGWVMIRVEPKSLLHDEGTLFPKVLLPAGVNQLHGNLSLAEFQDRVLVRSFGSDFGRYRMKEDVLESLKSRQELWEVDVSNDRKYLTYYHRREQDPLLMRAVQVVPASSAAVTAVRAPLNNLFDHLYYMLRITIAGLVIGGVLYVPWRLSWWRAMHGQRERVRFKDRVLNAFLVVGLFAVGVVGVIGLRVVTAENENAIQSWIRSQLERVEESLALRGQFGELPSETLNRINVNELAAQVGLDLNVYSQENELVMTSRAQLERDRLIEKRLPIEAYHALLYEGIRHAFTYEKVGEFEYMAGYRVLPDREGNPQYIISVPTLPEQERIEEERARTVAYLFGALLMMIVAVMLTASLLANTLSGPIGRLRRGLEAVAQGRFEQPLPVETSDEIGELVRTFNDMQEQLADSRRKLARQERQLAWREMARQVAHEIKNPLTPMKLSVQHLQRAFSDVQLAGPATNEDRWDRFKQLFQRITGTLIEQADALARIANEFSSFARLPTRVLETLDLNAVLLEAVSLMQEQADVDITTELHPEPLILQADREELRRIYINLIKNAIEATPEERAARLVVSTSLSSNGSGEDSYISSTITDNGVGIPVEVQNRIFEPNFSSKTSGTGLGLAIVKKSIEDLNGEIGFETAENEGTTFWIRLPLNGAQG